MHFTQKMLYMAFGCLLTLAGYILACASNDIVAQSGAEDVSFDEITCRRLIVRDDEGEISVGLANDTHGGYVAVYDKGGGRAYLYIKDGAGLIMGYSKDGNRISRWP